MSNQAITFKSKSLPKSLHLSRRNMLRRREQAARRQRWHDANEMVKFVLLNILYHPHDRQIKSEFEKLIERNTKRLKAKQSDEQIVFKAVRFGCGTIKELETETGLTSELIVESLNELQILGKVERHSERYQLTPKG